jgi:hypothetical protein
MRSRRTTRRRKPRRQSTRRRGRGGGICHSRHCLREDLTDSDTLNASLLRTANLPIELRNLVDQYHRKEVLTDDNIEEALELYVNFRTREQAIVRFGILKDWDLSNITKVTITRNRNKITFHYKVAPGHYRSYDIDL